MLNNNLSKLFYRYRHVIKSTSPYTSSLSRGTASSNNILLSSNQLLSKRAYSTDKNDDEDLGVDQILNIIKTIDKDLKNPKVATPQVPIESTTSSTASTASTASTTPKKRGRKPKNADVVESSVDSEKVKKSKKKSEGVQKMTKFLEDIVKQSKQSSDGKILSIDLQDQDLEGLVKDMNNMDRADLLALFEKTANKELGTSQGKGGLDGLKIHEIKNPLQSGATSQARPKISEDILNCDDNLLPKDILAQLDRYIIGQSTAKRAVSVALRNRWRRKRLEGSLKSDVYPKNILMVGPTGVGKTEIARRLAKIVNAPFVKVEATKYTEVGFHGADVDTMIRDLVEVSINNIKTRIANSQKETIELEVEREIVAALIGPTGKAADDLIKLYREKQLEAIEIEIDVGGSEAKTPFGAAGGVGGEEEGSSFFKVLFNEKSSSSKKKKMTVSEARAVLEKSYKEKAVAGNNEITKLAIQQAEQNGIVFIDEIDKVCTPKLSNQHGSDASTDGVQRDLLPIIEGCNVNTKYGMVDTSRILFIASGAFHTCKPSDLISELQGRLPIRVELKPLEQHDFFRILTEPDNNQIVQQQALLKTEGIDLKFTPEALEEIAKIAFEANTQDLNIGARRLHGIIERIVEDLSFNCDVHKGKTVILDKEDIKLHLKDMLVKLDLTKYII